MSNANNKPLVPKLRFPEFRDSGEWEENCILNIATMKARIGWQNLRQDEHLDNGEFFLVTGTDFVFERIYWFNAKFVSYDRYIQDHHIILKEGDILITKDGSIGKLAYVEDLQDKKATLNNGIFRIRVDKEISKFIFYTFLSTRFKYFLQKLSGGSSITHLYQKDFEKYQIAYPNIKEQQKIAACLSSLDDLITAETQKLAAYKAHKKGLMQKLFPGEGETVPEWRFPEFRGSGEWEEHVINDFAKVKTGNKDTQNKIDGGKYSFFVRSQTIERINSYSYDGEAILTSGDGVGVGKNFHYFDGKFDFHQRVYCIYDFKKFVSGYFVFQYFSEHFYKRVMQLSAKNSVDSVRMGMITEMPIRLSSRKEQQKIAGCLSSLDDLITAQSQKIDALKTHKKGLMQGLFPSDSEVEA